MSSKGVAIAFNPLTTVISLILFIVSIQFFIGWQTSIAFVSLLFVHEIGHVLAAYMRGIPCSIPIFIPFIGAFIAFHPDSIRKPQDEAWIGIGGPLIGAVGCTIALHIWNFWFSEFNEIGKGIGFAIFINLLNLIPVRPLDGGRVVQIIGRWFQVLSMILLAILSWYFFTPMWILVWYLVIREPRMKNEFIVARSEKFVWVILYLLLCLYLVSLLAYSATIVEM